MTTLADLRTSISRSLRDTSNLTWSVTEIDDLVNQGIDAIADFYPREIVQTLGTVSAGVSSYSATSFTRIYRLDIYSSAGTYLGEFSHGFGDADSGWELHGGVLYMPPNITLDTGNTLRAFGYGRYVQLAASTATTDLDASGIWALKVFCQMEALAPLTLDRAKFQQWQANANATDVTMLALAQTQGGMANRWRREQARLRRMRKS